MSQLSRDVRMKGFPQRSTVEQVRDWVDQHASLPNWSDEAFLDYHEVVPLHEAAGRVLAAGLQSRQNVPPFDRSAMDGFAIRSLETIGATDYSPCRFRITGESLPGRPAMVPVEPGTAVRVMTGAPLPAGADTVVPVEFTRPVSPAATSGRTTADGLLIDVTTAMASGKNVGRTGEDLRTGQEVFAPGRRLRPQDVGVAASLGVAQLAVIRRPRVSLLITGDELIPPGQPLGLYQIHEANSYMLTGLVERDGGAWLHRRQVPDDPDQVREYLRDWSQESDVILISGGSSVGQEDHAPQIVAELGQLAHHGIAMRPSSPAGLGRMGRSLVFLLPGNPVSCLCAYDFFAGRAIRLLGGLSSDWPYRTVKAVVSRKLVSAIGRVDYCRVRLGDRGVEPVALSGASILSSTTRADGFVVIPAESEGYGPGTSVEVLLYA